MKNQFQDYINQWSNQIRKYKLVFGLLLMVFSLAIFLLPELFAYGIATVLLVAGLSIIINTLSTKRKKVGQRSFNDGETTIYYTEEKTKYHD